MSDLPPAAPRRAPLVPPAPVTLPPTSTALPARPHAPVHGRVNAGGFSDAAYPTYGPGVPLPPRGSTHVVGGASAVAPQPRRAEGTSLGALGPAGLAAPAVGTARRYCAFLSIPRRRAIDAARAAGLAPGIAGAGPAAYADYTSRPITARDDGNVFLRIWAPRSLEDELAFTDLKAAQVEKLKRYYAVLLLHGAGMSSMGWDRCVALLAGVPSGGTDMTEAGDDTDPSVAHASGGLPLRDLSESLTARSNDNVADAAGSAGAHGRSSGFIYVGIDMRGHGRTTLPVRADGGSGGDSDLLSRDQLALDVASVIDSLRASSLGRLLMPDVFVIGHSVGGAVAAAVGAGAVAHQALLNAAALASPSASVAESQSGGGVRAVATTAAPALATNLREHLMSQAEARLGAAVPTGAAHCPSPSTAAAHAAAGFVFPIPLPKGALAGISVVDVVEDTAIESVMHMDEFLKRRPARFPSVGAAAEWFLRLGGMCSPTSARHSVPSLFVAEGASVADTLNPVSPVGEEQAAGSGARDLVEHAPEGPVKWITDLAATRMHWGTWFVGLDRMFLTAPCPRLLLVAKTDRLDKAMTVAHMQGAFQLELVRDAGHYLMEDTPEQAAAVLQRFLGRIETMQAQLCARLEAAAAKGAALLRASQGT